MTDPLFLALVALLALAGGLLVTELAILNPKTTAILTLIVLASPVFIDSANGLPTLTRLLSGSTVEAETGLHLAIPLIAIGAVVSFFRPLAEGGRLIVVLIGLYSLSALYGLVGGAGSLGFLYYVQTLIPLLAWFVFAHSGLSPRTVSLVVIATVAASLVLIIGASGLHGGYSVSAVPALAAAIPQYRNIFPFVMMCAVALAIAGWDQHRRASMALLTLGALALPLIWSRTGMLMLVVAVVVAYFLRPGRSTTSARLAFGIPIVVAIGFLLSTGLVEGVLGSRDVEALAQADASRLQLADRALEHVIANPIFGDAFVPTETYNASGSLAPIPLLYPAHNQYLDVAIRGGVVAAVIVVLLLAFFLRRSLTLSREGPDQWFHAALTAVVAATIVGNMTQLYMVQAWSGGLLFALLGVSSALARPHSVSGRLSTPTHRTAVARDWVAPPRSVAPASTIPRSLPLPSGQALRYRR